MNTKTIIYTLVVAAIIIGAFYFFRAPYQNSQTTSTSSATMATSTTTTATAVSIINFLFNPGMITINKGETVVWTNNDSVPHQIAGRSFNGPVINKGQTYSFIFNTAGSFNYHCAIHPSMTGTIVVK